jgi:hypothetical protein
MFSDWLGSETGPDKEASIAAKKSPLWGSHRHETKDRRDEEKARHEQNQGRRPLAFRNFKRIAAPEIFAIDVNRLASLDVSRGLHGTWNSHGQSLK